MSYSLSSMVDKNVVVDRKKFFVVKKINISSQTSKKG